MKPLKTRLFEYYMKTKFRFMYQWVAKNSSQEEALFMNYGFALPGQDYPLELQQQDEKYRYSIQLYHYVASAVNLEGLKVLEVGSGRGGGASFVKRYLKPKLMVGLDLSETAVEKCNAHLQTEGLTFQQGDAENLPFEDNSFDAVLNVESSHCYPNAVQFFKEVNRVLKPGGHFLFADLRLHKGALLLDAKLAEGGFDILNKEDITANIIESLDRDHHRKAEILKNNKNNSFLLNPILSNFAGLQGSPMYKSFNKRSFVYKRYILQKKSNEMASAA